jgi:hypothetical protein
MRLVSVAVTVGVCFASSHRPKSSAAVKWRARRAAAGLSMVPSWNPTWEVSKSTIFMPCNDSGFFNPASATAYGLAGQCMRGSGSSVANTRAESYSSADYDWSNAKQIWANQKPMNCEELLVEQAAMTKAYNNETRVFVYR